MHEAIIRDFYTAFNRKDYAAMQALYHPQATFYDPVFQQLDAAEVKAMWQMLLTSSRDLAVEALAGNVGIVVGDLTPPFMPVIGGHLHNTDIRVGESLQCFDLHACPRPFRLKSPPV